MHSRDDDAATHRGRAREHGRVDVDTRDRSIRPTSTEGTVNMAPERCLTRAFEDAGLVGSCERVTHAVTNRKLGVTLTRHFVQGRFVKR